MGWIASKLWNVTLSPKHVLGVVGLLVFACFLGTAIDSLFIVDEDDFDCSSVPSQESISHQEDHGKALVESIRRARRAASGFVDFDSPLKAASPEALKEWNDRHPCQSRRPDGLLSFYNRSGGKPAETVPDNPLWDEVFEEYSNLHRECMQKVGDIGGYFLQKNSSSGCKFLVADVSNRSEFGDKLLVLASSLLYAILTQRVILIPGSTLTPSYMCEPFAGSSWLLDSSSTFALLSSSSRDLWETDREMFRSTDWHRRPCSSSPNARAQPPYAAAGIGMDQWQPQQTFYCTRQQISYSETTFVYLSGFVYTIPKLFASPVLGPALEALFPDRIVLTRLLRSAFLPGNPIWKRVKVLHQGYLQPAHHRVGIELRYNSAVSRHKSMKRVINQRITDCLIESDILPNFTNTWEKRTTHQPSEPSEPPVVINQVLISSLQLDLKDHLTRIYERNPTLTRQAVGVVQVSQSSGTQQFSIQADVEAFKEALLLSFSDQLLVTPMSTLGSVAQAYGALIPWFIDVRKDGWFSRFGTCQRGQTIEACNHFATKKYACSSSDSSMNGRVVTDVVPFIENCLAIDHGDGIQLITSSRS